MEIVIEVFVTPADILAQMNESLCSRECAIEDLTYDAIRKGEYRFVREGW